MTKILPAKLVMSGAFLLFGIGELLFVHASHLPAMLLGAVATGAGFGFSIPTANHLIVEESPSGSRGRNLSYLSMAIFFGQFASSLATVGNLSAFQMLSDVGIASTAGAVVLVIVFRTTARA